ncbi:MAG: biotin transporter BioY [Eubacteriaceae bacterium]|jgi:biotin transport system substrate-specific component
MKKLTTSELCRTALFTALIAAGAFIKIPTPLVPITLQLGFVVLAGMLLGPRLGTLSVLLYVFLGLAGLPVFAQGGGLSYVFVPSFGYILGFIPGAWVAGHLAQTVDCSGKENRTRKLGALFLAALAGGAVIYAAGIVYLYAIEVWYMGMQIQIMSFLTTALFLPLPGDIVICGCVAVLTLRLVPALKLVRA